MIITTKKDIGRSVTYRDYQKVDGAIIGSWVTGTIVDIGKMTVTVRLSGETLDINRVDMEWAA